MDDEAVERVLVAVELIPAGRVASYGDIGEIAGVGPRQVGQIMAAYGSGVAWWRVTSSAGDLPAHLLPAALSRWEAEGIGGKPSGNGCRIVAFRVDLASLEANYRAMIPPELAR